MLKFENIILTQLKWVVGEGSKIRTFHDVWVSVVGQLINYIHPQGTPNQLTQCSTIDTLTISDGSFCVWNRDLLALLRPDEIVVRIMQLPLGGEDLRCWKSEPSGMCIFKTFYKEVQGTTYGPQLAWKWLWKLSILPNSKCSCGDAYMTCYLPGSI